MVTLRLKMYSYLKDDDHDECSEKKKAKGTKKCVIKREIKFQNYKVHLKNNKTILKSRQRFRTETHNLFTEKVNKIVLSANDDKRIQTLDGFNSYLYGTDPETVCK